MINIDIQELKRLYYDEKQSGFEIARHFQTSPVVIYNRMRKHGLPRRSYSDAHKLRYSGTERDMKSAEIIRLYFDENLSLQKVADRIGITPPTVWRFILLAGLTPRTRKESSKKGLSKWTKADRLEMKRLYCEEKLSCIKIARKFNSNSTTIQANLKKEGVPRRTIAEAHASRREKDLSKSSDQHQRMINKQIENLPELKSEKMTPARIFELRHKDNLTIDAIAEVCSLTNLEVYNILQRSC